MRSPYIPSSIALHPETTDKSRTISSGRLLARAAIAALITFILAAAASAAPPKVASSARSLLLLFETSKGEGADGQLASITTRALRDYFRDTKRVEPMIFNPDSATVLRAIMEKKLTADKVASYASQTERVEVAKALGFQYASGGEVAIRNGNVEVRLWVGQVEGKRGKWEATASAHAAGTGDKDLENAVQSASSAAVIDISRRAFTGLQPVTEPEPATGKDTTAIGGGQVPPTASDNASDLAAKADGSLKDGNIALAIQQYSQAVSADPANGPIRIKLANAYAQKGLFSEAFGELERASSAGADTALIADAKRRIEQMQSGKAAEPPKPGGEAEPPPSPDGTPGAESPEPTSPAVSAIGKMVEGDKLWRGGKSDEAAASYTESIKLNPRDWRAYERLALVSVSMSLFNEARKAIEQLKVVQPEPPLETVQRRYEMFRKAFDRQFSSLVNQYDSDAADFAAKKITRESYYSSLNGIALRLDAMARFLDTLTVPAAKEPANLRRGLACGLMAQAASSLLDYVETNNEKSKSNAATFASQAAKQMAEAVKLDENKVIVVQ